MRKERPAKVGGRYMFMRIDAGQACPELAE